MQSSKQSASASVILWTSGSTCLPRLPSAFVRYAIYAAIALLEVVILFTWSLRVEQRMRNRHYAPEWR